MKNVERRDRQLPYISDAEVMEQQMNARRLTQKLNTIDRSDFDGIAAIVKELFGKSEGAFVNPPFYCDYGFHIEVGKNFFANYNCTILDVAKVKIGDNCQMAPNVAIYTAGHPVHPAARNSAYEYGIEVTIGDNVWIGGNTVILPGVHIGDNVVIGGGSVVTKTFRTGRLQQEIRVKSFGRLPKKINSTISEIENLMMKHGRSSKICKNEMFSWAVMRRKKLCTVSIREFPGMRCRVFLR